MGNQLAILVAGDEATARVRMGTCTIEQAAYALLSQMLLTPAVLEDAAMRALFETLSDAELPRETCYAQSMDTWDAATADVLKEQEWARVIAALQAAKQESALKD